MQVNDARSGKRFLTYLIDMFLVNSIASLILTMFPFYRGLLNEYQSLYTAFTTQLTETGAIDPSFYSELMSVSIKIQGLTILTVLPIMILYLVVLPYFWKAQTIGRLVMGVRVTTVYEQKPSLKNLLFRELIGGFLCYQILSRSIVIPIITWVFSATRGRSLADLIGGTRLINTRIASPNVPVEEERDYVDATFKEVEKYSTEEEEKPSSNDEYKVF